jgi:hypothetical protein
MTPREEMVVLITTTVAGLFRHLPRAAAVNYAAQFETLSSVVGDAYDRFDKARKSGLHSDAGLREIARPIAKETAALLAPFKSRIEERRRDLDNLRQRVRDVKRPAKERTTEGLLVEREIRDRLHAMISHPNIAKDETEKGNRMRVERMYLEALQSGDQPFIDAIESAPAAFPLISDTTRRQADDMKLKMSGLADAIKQREAEFLAAEHLVARAEGLVAQSVGAVETAAA